MKKFKKFLLSVSVFVFVLLFSTITAFAGKSMETATPIELNENYTATINSWDDAEYYRFTPQFSGCYYFESYGDYDTVGMILDSDGEMIAKNHDISYDNSNFRVSEHLDAGKTYYFCAMMLVSGDTGSFTVKLYSYDDPAMNLSNATISLSTTSYTYSGSAKRPTVTVKDEDGNVISSDNYAVYYSNNVNAGTAKVTVYGVGAYSGSKSKTFKINPKSLSGASVKLSATSYTYSGSAKNPGATVTLSGKTLKKNTDFTISYKNNKNVGKGTATITGKGNYKGSINKTFTIKAKKITSFKIYNATYNGKAQIPAVYYSKKVTDEYGNSKTTYVKYKKNTDYTISVSGKHKAIGQYTAKVKFKGNYTGTVSKTFQILPKPVKSVKTSPASTTEIKVSWSKVDNVSGYKIYRYNQKTGKFSLYKTTSSTSIKIKRTSSDDIDVGFYVRTYKKVGKKTYYSDSSKNCYDYEYVKPAKPSFTIKKINFGEFIINFKKVNYYEVQVSANKNFKNTVSNRVATFRGCGDSLLAYNLTSGKRYYVRARAYYYDKKGNLKVGPWSDVKSVVSY